MTQLIRGQTADDATRLQTHEQKRHHVQDEHHDDPHRVRMNPIQRRHRTVTLGGGHRGGDHREDRRYAQALGEHPGGEGEQELEQDAAQGADEKLDENAGKPAGDEAQQQSPGNGQRQSWQGVRDRPAVGGHLQGHAEDQQRDGIVQQALALEHGDRGAGDVRATEHGGRRGGVGG